MVALDGSLEGRAIPRRAFLPPDPRSSLLFFINEHSTVRAVAALSSSGRPHGTRVGAGHQLHVNGRARACDALGESGARAS